MVQQTESKSCQELKHVEGRKKNNNKKTKIQTNKTFSVARPVLSRVRNPDGHWGLSSFAGKGCSVG
jgi:hypothetical protein